MISSMTGFASAKGESAPYSWAWELRGVNGRGLDMRLRVPDWLVGLESDLRGQLSKALSRGNVTLSLRIARDEEAGLNTLNRPALAAVLDAVAEAEADAKRRGLELAPSRASDLLGMRGVFDAGQDEADTGTLTGTLKQEFSALIAAFVEMRRDEGAKLAQLLGEQLEETETLTARARDLAEARKDSAAAALQANLARILENGAGADPDRVAQELALIATKADVTEELDRLGAHIQAARALLAKGGAVGRKLDFLMQEFNREANTLCSKSQSSDLTAEGLALKAVIDQMREQVQNIE